MLYVYYFIGAAKDTALLSSCCLEVMICDT